VDINDRTSQSRQSGVPGMAGGGTTGSSGSTGSGASTAAAGKLMNTLREQASSRLSSQKDRAADGLTSVVEAVRQTGQQLREKNGGLASYVDSAAAELERWGSHLRTHDVADIANDIKAFARRRPAMFLGGGVALGLIAARFLKSSGEGSGTSNRNLSAPRYSSGFSYPATPPRPAGSTMGRATPGLDVPSPALGRDDER
jgi:hypothetical protein